MSVFPGAKRPESTSCNVKRHSMSDWQTQVDKLLADNYEGITYERYAAGLTSFRTWYLQSYNDEPDAQLFTDDEVRDYRVYLTGVKGIQGRHSQRVPGADPRPRARPGSNAQGQGRETGARTGGDAGCA
jgi:hypothetical protein